MKRVLFFLFYVWSLSLKAQTLLVVPDTLTGPSYVLTMHEDSVQFFPGNKSRTYAYNSNKYLGPTLIFNKGEQINITVNNQISDTTTLHWHGIHIPAKWDGGPHSMILPGASWYPNFIVMDHAATYWYHPHMHMKTAAQAIKGAAGIIIVRDSIESTLNLPRRYGIDDFPIVVQCQQYDTLNQAMPLGMEDSTLLVNGARANNGHSVYVNLPAQVIRFRVLNASGERTFNFGLSGNKHFKIITSDGGLLNAPIDATRIRLSPGERAEILIDLNGMNGQTIYLMSYASELPMGMQGGPTMPMPPGSPAMDSPLNGIDFNIMQLNVVAMNSNPITTIPSTLVNNVVYPTTSTTVMRTIRFTADSTMVMDGPFYFNDSSFNMMRIDYKIPLNSVEKWKLVNETMVAHPFHIHDVQFYLIDRNGMTPPPEELGRKDVVLVPSYDSVVFVTKFEDFTDSVIPYMYHCHILMHEDDGMMGQFTVINSSTNVNNEHLVSTKNVNVYPNPSSSFITVDFDNHNSPFDVRITDVSGKVIFTKNLLTDKRIDISELPIGNYILLIKSNSNYYSTKIMKY